MTQTSPDIVQMDAAGRLVTEVPCLQCGYLLRGRLPEDHCSECGFPIVRSIAAQDIRSWPRQWLRRVHAGLVLLAVGTIVGIVFVLWFGICTIGSLSIPDRMTFARYGFLMQYLWEPGLAGLLIIAVGLGIWGMLLVTLSSAARAISPARLWERRVVRWTFFLSAMSLVVLITLLFFIRGAWKDFLFWLWLIVFAAGANGIWSLLNHLSRLARKMGQDRIALRCRAMRWVMVVALALAFFEAGSLWPVITWLPIRSRFTWWRIIALLDTGALVGRVALVAAGMTAVHLLGQYRRAIVTILRARDD